jgi:hypothetical protein
MDLFRQQQQKLCDVGGLGCPCQLCDKEAKKKGRKDKAFNRRVRRMLKQSFSNYFKNKH